MSPVYPYPSSRCSCCDTGYYPTCCSTASRSNGPDTVTIRFNSVGPYYPGFGWSPCEASTYSCSTCTAIDGIEATLSFNSTGEYYVNTAVDLPCEGTCEVRVYLRCGSFGPDDFPLDGLHAIVLSSTGGAVSAFTGVGTLPASSDVNAVDMCSTDSQLNDWVSWPWDSYMLNRYPGSVANCDWTGYVREYPSSLGGWQGSSFIACEFPASWVDVKGNWS